MYKIRAKVSASQWLSRGDARFRWRRKLQIDRRSLALDSRALHPDRASHRFGKRPAEVQTKAIARHVRRQVARQPYELLEQQGNLSRRDAQSKVAHCDLHPAARLARLGGRRA